MGGGREQLWRQLLSYLLAFLNNSHYHSTSLKKSMAPALKKNEKHPHNIQAQYICPLPLLLSRNLGNSRQSSKNPNELRNWRSTFKWRRKERKYWAFFFTPSMDIYCNSSHKVHLCSPFEKWLRKGWYINQLCDSWHHFPMLVGLWLCTYMLQ